jgi:hypothetical protein
MVTSFLVKLENDLNLREVPHMIKQGSQTPVFIHNVIISSSSTRVLSQLQLSTVISLIKLHSFSTGCIVANTGCKNITMIRLLMKSVWWDEEVHHLSATVLSR